MERTLRIADCQGDVRQAVGFDSHCFTSAGARATASGRVDCGVGMAATENFATTSDLRTITDPLQHTTTFNYNGAQALTTIQDPLGHVTTIDASAERSMAGPRTSCPTG